ncbi:MAG: triose-phosphate isomerase [bacterium]|nr:triose-phosphate isomerase [bacterium]
MRKPIIAGNWKMHNTPDQAENLIKELVPLVKGLACEVVVGPTFVCLERAAKALAGSNIVLAAQNVHWEPKGAFTGEIAPGMLAALGVKYVIVGHSERRQYFGETDESVNKRAKAVLAGGMTPIVCVGETLTEREAGRMETVITTQVKGGLAGLDAAQVRGLVIAYEPVWAIGTGKVATNEQAQEVHALIRGLLVKLYDKSVADAVRIQYGGSVKPDNAEGLLGQPDIDGALVGGASLKAADFAGICRAAR